VPQKREREGRKGKTVSKFINKEMKRRKRQKKKKIKTDKRNSMIQRHIYQIKIKALADMKTT
jgi:hypothetical protein